MQSKPESSRGERQAFGLRLLKSFHPELRQLRGRHQPTAQGHKAWNATWLLLDYLQRQELPPGLRVLDVGCGWGLTGIFCASRYQARVTAVDVDPQVFPFLQLHARLNEVEIQTLEASFEEITDELLEQHDLLVGADICFKERMVEPLYQLCSRALQAGVSRVLLADPGRFSFRQLAAQCVQNLDAAEQEWETDEPLLSWPGTRLRLQGRLLLVDRRT